STRRKPTTQLRVSLRSRAMDRCASGTLPRRGSALLGGSRCVRPEPREHLRELGARGLVLEEDEDLLPRVRADARDPGFEVFGSVSLAAQPHVAEFRGALEGLIEARIRV